MASFTQKNYISTTNIPDIEGRGYQPTIKDSRILPKTDSKKEIHPKGSPNKDA